MKKLTRFWGVFIAIVLASTLILSAAPVSAGTLSWGSEDLPDEFTDGGAADSVTDMAISGDGSVIYIAFADAVNNRIKRSTNGGESWSNIVVVDGTPPVAMTATYIAVAPDDPNYIAAMNTAGLVYISDDAGANWDSLGTCGAGAVYDLELSVEKGGNHFVAVAGDDGVAAPGNQAELWYYEIGAIAAGWTDAWTNMGGADPAVTDESCQAVAFSPNFYSDQVMVAVSFYQNEINYSMYSFNTSTWNSGAFSDFPKNLQQGSDDLVTMQSASLALAPDFLGSDDAMRVAFVGVAADPAAADDIESEGIFRMDDTDVEVLKDEQAIKSIDFDGDLLVAGHLEEVTIYRSTDPLESSPSVSSSTGTKEPGGVDTVIVGIVGDSVVATTQGAEAAFAYSEDNGKTFNDLSMIDTDIGSINDVVMTPDGSKVYLVTRATGGELSVWSLDERWERIYNDDSAGSDYIIRMAPDDSEVVYLGELGGTDMRFSSDGGFGKWQTRVYKETSIEDLAIETDGDTVYVLTSGGYVSKSTNRGFTWGSKKSSKVTGDDSISCMGEDMVVVGGDGRVSYSTDGNSSWTKLTNDGWAGGVTETKVVATGLNDGDFVIAADGDGVNAFELGSDDEWDDITPTSVNTSMACSGMQLVQGVLYVTAYDTAATTRDNSVLARTLNPTADDPTWSNIPKWDVKFDVDPLALSGSVDGDVTKLWAIDSGSAVAPPALRAPALFSYKDTLAVIGVDLSQPLDAGIIPFNPVSGASHQIIFTWTSPSDKVSKFDFVIATDSGFDEVVLDESVLKAGTWDEGDIISKIVGPGAAGNFAISFMPETTYYWRVRVNSEGPVRSAWSEVRSFTTGALPEAQPPVIIEQAPAPVIQAPEMPEIVVEAPEVVIPEQPAPEIVIPEQPAPAPAVPTWAIYAIIIIGAVLVIALIVLIMRTRRPV
jgi:hypothetical protein